MKKIIALLLTIALIFCFAGCGTENGTSGTPKSNKVKVIDLPLSSEEYAFAIAKDNTEFLGKVNDFLAKIQTNGQFDEICNKYFGNGQPTKFKSAALDTSKEQLVVATSTGFEPFEMVANDEYYGIDLEIAYLLGQELGLEVVIQDMDFDAVVNSVQSGICNIGMAGLSVNPERQKVVTFSNTYYNASQVVVAMEDDTTFDACKTGDEVAAILDGFDASVKIGCQGGTTGELYIKGSQDSGLPGLKAEAAPYKYVALAITAMQQGQVKYVIVDNGPAKAVSTKLNEQ